MPLAHGYGLLIGRLDGYQRDRPDDQGRWFHDNLNVTVAAAERYRAAVDVDSHQSSTGVQWKVVTVNADDLSPAGQLGEGYHPLTSDAASGALDHIRSPLTRSWRLRWRPSALGRWTVRVPVIVHQPWKSGSNVEAADALERILVPGHRVLIWGEPFTTGLGMHNVHQNQGDPAGSQWWEDDGIWQDGGVAVPDAGGTCRLFVSKFSSQSSRTDADGHPA